MFSAGHDVERTAYLPKGLLLDTGHNVTVVGVLAVIAYPPAVVNSTRVLGWTEHRVSRVQ